MGERTPWTPGPWEPESEYDELTDSLHIYAPRAKSGEKLPAVCSGPNTEANARLISKAPELVEALADFLFLADAKVASLEEADAFSAQLQVIRERARTLLSEVKGGS